MKPTSTHIGTIACIITLLVMILLQSCSTTRHVPDGQYLLNKVVIKTDKKEVPPNKLYSYVQQNPNYRILGLIPLQLGIYNLSGQDTTKSINRWLRKIGNAPILYNEEMMEASCFQINKALSNMGYMHAHVEADTTINKKRLNITYSVTTNDPFYIDTLIYNIPHVIIDSIIQSRPSIIKKGMLLDRATLNQERDQITALIRNNGYYDFNKDYITFNADTTATSRAVELTISLHPKPSINNIGPASYDYYKRYIINEVYILTDPQQNSLDLSLVDVNKSEIFKGKHIIYNKNQYITKEALVENCFIEPGQPYSSTNVDMTYSSFGRLTYLKSINVRFNPIGETKDNYHIDCYIFTSPGKAQNISVELEGTNSEGDLGVAAQLTYQHRNIFKGSEILTGEVRGAYESLSGTLQDIINDNYTEVGGLLRLKFPKFLFPFLSSNVSRQLFATTDFDASINYQQRPEYTRIIAGAAWRYNWANDLQRHRLNLLDINYVYLPRYMDGFFEGIAPTNPLLRYSYEDHFIMSIGYNFYTGNIPRNNLMQNTTFPEAYTLRASVEAAGNLLYGISNALGPAPEDGYRIFGIRYSQYVKGNLDFGYIHNFNDRHTIAFHTGLGIGIPYGNSSVMPFEKRFYSGGANSVRGWSVRSLGPGSYNGQNNPNNFIYQCGDIRFDMSLEYRAKLFWKIESAIFIDAGNIWTIADYETQPGGAFRFDTFYKQIALAYGVGIRLNFDFVVIRSDFGMKAYNPADGEEKWAIIHPNLKRDFAWHITIGYPF